MLPTRWDPFRELSRDLGSLHRELDELFRRTFGGREMEKGETRAFTPRVNTYAKGGTFFVKAELPGMSKEDLDVNVEGRMLTLRGERKEDKEIKEENYYLHEARFGSFVRRLELPEGVDVESVRASYEGGVLEISMPMRKAEGGRKVSIEGPKKKALH